MSRTQPQALASYSPQEWNHGTEEAARVSHPYVSEARPALALGDKSHLSWWVSGRLHECLSKFIQARLLQNVLPQQLLNASLKEKVRSYETIHGHDHLCGWL